MGQTGYRPVRHFHTKIVGVSHRNPDGSERQRLIRDCQVLETLELDHEESNPNDPNAVRVLRKTGQQLGYLRAELAAEIVSKAKSGYRFVVFIKDITGNERKGQSLGVNLLVIQAEPGVGDGPVKKYLKHSIGTDPELQGAKIGGGGRGKLIALALIIASGVILYLLMRRR
jgi:hypothetical protein